MILVSQDKMTMTPFNGSTVKVESCGLEMVEIRANGWTMAVYGTKKGVCNAVCDMIDAVLKGAEEFQFPEEVTE